MNFNENCEVFLIFKGNRHTERSEVSKMDTLALNLFWIFPFATLRVKMTKRGDFSKNSQEIHGIYKEIQKNSRNLRIFKIFSKNFHQGLKNDKLCRRVVLEFICLKQKAFCK